MGRVYDLQDRLVKFGIKVLQVVDILPRKNTARGLASQISRSGIAPALLYGEAQAAESTADFIHKLKILLKELRETKVSLRIILEKPIMIHPIIISTFHECNELIAIFTASVKTSKESNNKKH